MYSLSLELYFTFMCIDVDPLSTSASTGSADLPIKDRSNSFELKWLYDSLLEPLKIITIGPIMKLDLCN
jgi:hypothetical protein